MIFDIKNPHYVSIKDLNRFMTNKTKYHGKKHFCLYCLQCFSSSKISECHKKNCLAINHTKSASMLEEGPYNKFKDFKKLSRTAAVEPPNLESQRIQSRISV